MYGSCVVLLYHRVTDIESDPQLLCVKPKNFENHISLLSKKFKVLTVEEFKFYIENKKKFPKKSVLLTFDDGYADNYLEALPILEKYKSQALFYIATGTLNTKNEYWWDAVERIILLSKSNPGQEKYTLNNKDYTIHNLNKTQRFELYEKLLPELRILSSEKREKTINELAILFESIQPRDSHQAMTFEELKKMNSSNSAIIGAHTHLHPSLAALSYNEQLEEIRTSKEKLEELLSKKIVHFSYPFGTKGDFNEDTLAIVKRLGFELAAANYPYIVHYNSDKFQFPRFLVRDWDIMTFENELNSFFN